MIREGLNMAGKSLLAASEEQRVALRRLQNRVIAARRTERAPCC